MIKISNRKDFYAGLIFLFFGILTLAINRSYPMGTAARMGPGFFPFLLGIVVALLGFLIAARSLMGKVEEVQPLAMRPLVLVLGAVVAFAILIQPLGLLLGVLALVVISSLGGPEWRLRDVVILYFVLAAMAVGLFVYGLGLPFKVWPL
jgi:NADH:ubiquinone oxidoreductase subunit 2 (subunit N)